MCSPVFSSVLVFLVAFVPAGQVSELVSVLHSDPVKGQAHLRNRNPL